MIAVGRWARVGVCVVLALVVGISVGLLNRGGQASGEGQPDASLESACSELDASEAIASVPGILRAGVAGEPVEGLSAAVDRLNGASDVLPAAGSAADELELWASAPENLDLLDAVADQFAVLEEEVAARCE